MHQMTKEQILEAHDSERSKCTVYTRVMGYHRPVETFNVGKQGEFRDRLHFNEPQPEPSSGTEAKNVEKK